MKLRNLIPALGLLLSLGHAAQAQYNQKGRFHLAIGASLGAHATELKSDLLGFKDTDTDGAATTSVPIQIAGALTNRFTLGLLIEPGHYVPDSANADTQTNSFINIAIEPRFYLINADRIAWTASAQLGGVGLRIQDDTPGQVVDARYSGTAFGLGSGVAFGFGEHVGLGFDLRYLSTNLELRAMEYNDVNVMDFYSATLRTSGFVAQLSLALRFGGA